MMAGFAMVQRVHRLEKQLADLGMRWGHDKHSGSWGGSEFGDRIAVFPRDEELPVYSRDACLFTGTIDDLQTWINGIQWARDYDMINKVSDEKKRARKEQDYRNQRLVGILKDQQPEVQVE